ncbi:MAG: hypothetical protein AB9873_03440 [Syntrophobacteraceae bacterium]
MAVIVHPGRMLNGVSKDDARLEMAHDAFKNTETAMLKARPLGSVFYTPMRLTCACSTHPSKGSIASVGL